MSEQTNTTAQIKLPERMIGSVDMSRTIRELKAIDDWLNQAALRGSGQAVSIPKTSTTLEEVASLNGISLLDKNHRQQLIAILDAFSVHAPRIHMSFAVEPSAPFTRKMVIWLRSNVNPVILLEIGLQPTLAAGCTVRTTNKLFDMSLRHRFTESRLELVKSIARSTVEPEKKPQEAAQTTEKAPVTASADKVADAAPATPTQSPPKPAAATPAPPQTAKAEQKS